MYTVIVADDETELRRSMIARTPWEACGFRVIGEAENGMEALKLVEKLNPDLLLTDIRMPFLSGIALARAVREIRPAMHIAFISGYDDFTYAQQAIQYNIISYMLKPISSEELAQELHAIKLKIDQRLEEISLGRPEKLHPHDFLMPLLLSTDMPQSGEELEKFLHEQAVACGLLSAAEDTPHYVVLATMLRKDDGTICTERSHVRAVERVLHKYLRSVSCFISGRVVSLVASGEYELSSYLHIAVSEISQSFERATGIQCTVGVSREVDLLSGCSSAYHESINALWYQGDVESRFIMDMERGIPFHIHYADVAGHLEGLIKSGDLTALETWLEELFDSIVAERFGKVEINWLIVQLLATACRASGVIEDATIVEELWHSAPILGFAHISRSFYELQQKTVSFCKHVSEVIASQRHEVSESVCEQALDIIRKQFQNESLSLVSISETLHISPNYLSALIRKNTGETFINLLTATRLDHAQGMLENTSYKVMDIAEHCGYSDQHYFSYCFKKRFGLSPLALRRQKQEEGGRLG